VLPEAREQIAWGEPTFRVRKKLFAMYANADNHHGRGRSAVWIKARAVNQHLLIVADPDRFFVPPYVGPGGWVGVWLDRRRLGRAGRAAARGLSTRRPAETDRRDRGLMIVSSFSCRYGGPIRVESGKRRQGYT